MAKKNEQEIVTEVDNRLHEIAQTLGVESGENETNLLEKVVARLQQMNDNLMPLVEQMDADKRVAELLAQLAKGLSLDEAVEVVMSVDEDTQKKNIEKAFVETTSFCEKHKMEHSDIECFVDYIEALLSKIERGEIDAELLDSFRKSFAYDNDMKDSFEAGVVKGRNMQIEATRAEREEDDGLGDMSSGGDTERRAPRMGYIEQIIKNRR